MIRYLYVNLVHTMHRTCLDFYFFFAKQTWLVKTGKDKYNLYNVGLRRDVSLYYFLVKNISSSS